MFCPELQKLLNPIYDLTRKGRPFTWEKGQQDSIEEIKCRLIKSPVLPMPSTGSALYQIQNGKPKLIMYGSKRLPEAEKIYSIRELE